MNDRDDHQHASLYKDDGNLRCGSISIQDSAPTLQGWHRSVFEHLPLGDGSRVLELGRGPAVLWTQNRLAVRQASSLAPLSKIFD